MNSTTRSQFTTLFGGGPDFLFTTVMVLLVGILGIALLKIIQTAWNDVRTGAYNDFDNSDFFTTIIRALVILLIFGAIFSD
jgi:hypothetical protein